MRGEDGEGGRGELGGGWRREGCQLYCLGTEVEALEVGGGEVGAVEEG